MESPDMSSGNTGPTSPYTLIERLRDHEYPDYLYTVKDDELLRKFWYENHTLRYATKQPPAFDKAFDVFMTDYHDESTIMRLEDTDRKIATNTDKNDE